MTACTATDHAGCTPALCGTAAAGLWNNQCDGGTTGRLARVEVDRERIHRLLDQTRAALRVALYHLRDRPGLADDDAHERRENELAGCRIALKDATEAVEAAELGTAPDLAPVVARQWSVRGPNGQVEGKPRTEAAARQWADVIGGEVVYRAVGPWQSAGASDGGA